MTHHHGKHHHHHHSISSGIWGWGWGWNQPVYTRNTTVINCGNSIICNIFFIFIFIAIIVGIIVGIVKGSFHKKPNRDHYQDYDNKKKNNKF
jgi:hypothetical protein